MQKITEFRVPKSRVRQAWEDGVKVQKVERGFGLRPVTTTKPGIRFLHYLIDSFICVVSFSVFGAFLMLAGVMDDSTWEDLAGLGFYAFWIAYYIAFEGLFQRTLGKMITGSWVIDEYGNRPPFLKLMGRNFARLIPFEAISCFWERGWHDKLSNTYVVPKKEYREIQEILANGGQTGELAQGEEGFQEDFF